MPDSSELLLRFTRLMRELEAGLTRNAFSPWEVELLLDFARCHVNSSERRRTLRRYERAARRRIEAGGSSLLKLSEYLAARTRRRSGRLS